MGGYNTVCETLSLDRPALIVPRTAPRAEQVLRAERLAARGLVSMIRPEALSPEVLGTWLATSPSPAAAQPKLDMTGLQNVRAYAEHILTAPREMSLAS